MRAGGVESLSVRAVFAVDPLTQQEEVVDWSDPFSGHFGVEPGEDVADMFKITKYEPPIPTALGGEVWVASGLIVKFDVESYERHPDVFAEDDPCEITEKLHGTYTQIGFLRGLNHPEAFMSPEGTRDVVVSSKGLGAKELAFKDVVANEGNLYARSAKTVLALPHVLEMVESAPLGLILMGETYGRGVQDLHYGLANPHFRVFDIMVDGHYLSPDDRFDFCNKYGLEHVPVLYRGPFSRDKLVELASGKDTLSGSHIREGVVVRHADPTKRDPEIGRCMVKLVSDDYKFRKGNNITEFT